LCEGEGGHRDAAAQLSLWSSSGWVAARGWGWVRVRVRVRVVQG